MRQSTVWQREWCSCPLKARDTVTLYERALATVRGELSGDTVDVCGLAVTEATTASHIVPQDAIISILTLVSWLATDLTSGF
jgi:hypothetical protein